MKDARDAIRLKLSGMGRDTPKYEMERMASHIANSTDAESIVDLLAEEFKVQQSIMQTMAECEVRLECLMKARIRRRYMDREGNDG